MAWQPIFEETAEGDLIPKVMAVVHRDMKEALDHWYAADNLPDFAVMTDGDVDQFTYPLLVVANESGSSADTNSGEWLDQEFKFRASIGVEAATVKLAREKIKKYRRVLVAVIRKSQLEILPDESQYMDYGLVFRWVYFKHGEKGVSVQMGVRIEATITFGEK